MNENHSLSVKYISLYKIAKYYEKTTYKTNKLYSLSITRAG